MKEAILYLIIFTSILSCSSDKSNSQNDDLLGKWKLTAFVNKTDGTILTASDFENSNEITIDFKEDRKYVGYTVLNDFFGGYIINDSEKNVLILNEVWGTEVNETVWGHLFFDSLNLNYNQSTNNWVIEYELYNDVLKLHYSENEYMKFEKMW